VNQPKSSATKTSHDKSTTRSWWLLVLIFRLLLLAVGGGVALLSGILLAYFYPNPNPEKPLILRMLERIDKNTIIPSVGANPRTVPVASNSPTKLTSTQRQQAQAQLNQLQAQLRLMNEAVKSLENQLGTSHPNETLEARMQAIAMQLEGISPSTQDTQAVGNTNSNQALPVSDSLSSTNKFKVTLPSDLLFEQDNSILRPEAGLILDKIVSDLRSYPSNTIRIAAHTDDDDSADANQELTFRRAKAVQQYLISALGDRYRWIVLGYGGTHPLVTNDTDANRQRNRRVEIAID
jgi:outer membrane protein OmpA-like peptidoglycan-associated protein